MVQPNGNVYRLRTKTEDERRGAVRALCARWENYCTGHWLSDNHEEPYCPENKVKRFLDGLAYFLMLGESRGIVTDYKQVRNGDREIPLSSCPPGYEDLVYGGGATGVSREEEETLRRAYGHDRKPNKKPCKTPERYARIARLRREYEIREWHYPRVDTNGVFQVLGETHRVRESATQYAGKETKEGTLYDMDKVICLELMDGGLRFFDMRLEPIDIDGFSGTS